MFAFKIKEPVLYHLQKTACLETRQELRLKIATNRLNLGNNPRATVRIGSIPSKYAKKEKTKSRLFNVPARPSPQLPFFAIIQWQVEVASCLENYHPEH